MMRFNALVKIAIIGALMFGCIGIVNAANEGYTGGSYDGYGSGVSVDFNLGGPNVTISSSATQSFVVSQASTVISSIIITDSTGGAITALNGLRITIPSGLAMEWDTTKTTATITSVVSFKVSPAVTYENLNKTLVLNIIYDFAAGESFTLTGLSFTNFTAASSSDYLGLDIYNTGVSYLKVN